MIEVNESIDVAAPPQTVWEILSNPREVVECVPGAALGEQHEDGSFDASVTVKFGPAKVAFQARVSLDLDEAARTGNVSARGKDNQGGTRFRTSMHFGVVERADAPGSTIPIQATVDITGRLSGLIETGASMVVKRMTREFSEALAARLAGAGTAQS